MPKKVLLVDDSTTTLMMEEMILKQRTTYECITAKDGMDAISRAVVEAPDATADCDPVQERDDCLRQAHRQRLAVRDPRGDEIAAVGEAEARSAIARRDRRRHGQAGVRKVIEQLPLGIRQRGK